MMEQDENFGIGANNEYLNVRFGLFADEEITAKMAQQSLKMG